MQEVIEEESKTGAATRRSFLPEEQRAAIGAMNFGVASDT
jgi:hypothetical protein